MEHEELRKKIWYEAFKSALEKGSVVSHKWADEALEAFDNKFKPS